MEVNLANLIPFETTQIIGDPTQEPPSEENNWGGYGSKEVMEYVCLRRYESLDRLDPL